MIPAGRLVALAAVPVLVSIAYVAADIALWLALAVDAAVLLVAAVDAWLLEDALTATRAHPNVVSVGKAAEVRLEVSQHGTRSLQIRVHDDVAGQVEGLPVDANLGPGQSAKMAYSVTFGRRGAYTFGHVVARWCSPLGLWWRQRALGEPSEIHVYPDFTFLRETAMASRQLERAAASRVRRQRGGENEFQRLRHYVAGDPYRHIDWKATARRQRFISREYGQDSNQNVIFMLDAGRLMTSRIGEITAFDHALNAALGMGQAALRHGDRVGMLVFDQSVRVWLPPRGGARSGHRLIRGTYDVFPTLQEPDYGAAFRHLSGAVRQRSLVVLLTAVMDDVNADMALSVMRAVGTRHLPLCVWLRDQAVDSLVDAPPDGELSTFYSRCAAAKLSAWRARGLAEMRRKGVMVVDCHPEKLSHALLGRYLEIKARRML